MTDDIGTNWCSICGGALRVVDGTDTDTAEALGYFEETYRCTVCKQTGTFTIGLNGTGESATGVVAQ